MDDPVSVDDLVRAIDVNYTEGVPDEAFVAARDRRDEIIPHLIALIRRETQVLLNRQEPSGTSGFYGALFLLTEFKAKEALPAIIESLSLPHDDLFDLWGDIIHEHVSGILAELADEDFVNRLMDDRSLNEYVRWEAAQTLLHWVRDGRMTRDAAVECLRSHLVTALANSDREGIVGLVSELFAYAPREAMAEIREVYARKLQADFGDTIEHYEETLINPDRRLQKSLQNCSPTGCEDAVAELHGWFDEGPEDSIPDFAADEAEWNELEEDFGITPEEDLGDAASTIHRAKVKVGRNDPCSCGSGKKYKKCCGRGG